MFNVQKYKANAARCAELAGIAVDPADRAIWVKIAYGWLEMATDVERGASRVPEMLVAARGGIETAGVEESSHSRK
jgi:hypothetical protein